MNAEINEKGLVTCSDGRIRPRWATASDLMQDYYDYEWGKPLTTEDDAFERLVLEGFQAGLSWETVLKKRAAFREAFANFHVDTVADYNEADIERLLNNPAIIRNRKKICAAITNACCVQELRDDGGLLTFLSSFAPTEWNQPESLTTAQTTSAESIAMSTALKARGFKFVGPTTCFALMEATGMINNRVVGSSDLK
ncbi:DNA-3-methyladenine glycosylase I [Corynebacterium hindlerae]|uniref:DNA-3-methyladenine glycosylase I n=1 Tax=Corynebacterium hindlerae TaxID=699041 RepID=A0A7G5FCN2_9CORY|nr:DNA-3-methyladenine glycosylase I [Corynebacterium hindlerae]QMV84373.1 DNA-3-methyladenine glycosylase I [Corynebacterium hindlerae]